MKKIFLSAIVAAAAALPTFAAVDTLNYSAVVRNANGEPIADQEVSLLFQFIQNNDVIFDETVQVKTSAAGVVNYAIGSSKSLENIDWTANDIKLAVSMDVNGGEDFAPVSNSDVASVPTALYALKSADTETLYNDVDQLYSQNMRTEVRLDNIYADFANLGENLDNFANEMDARFTEVNGQLENLNMVAAVVRTNEEQIEKNTADIAEVKKDAYDAFEDIYQQLGIVDQLVSAVETLDAWHRDNDENLLGLPATLNAMNEAIEENTLKLEEMENANRELVATLQTLDNLANDNANDIEALQGEDIRLQTNINTVFDKVGKAEEDIDVLGEANIRLENTINTVFAKVAAAEDDIDNIYEQLEAANGTIRELKGEVITNKAEYQEDFQRMADVSAEMSDAVNNLTTAVEGLVKDNEETQASLRAMGAEVARIDGLAADFENFGENLDNLVNEMDARFQTVHGQLENLNMLGEVVRANEDKIAEIEVFNQGVSDELAKLVGLNAEEIADFHDRVNTEVIALQEKTDSLDAAFENLGENLDKSFAQVTAIDTKLDGVIENLDMSFERINAQFEEYDGYFNELGKTTQDVETLKEQMAENAATLATLQATVDELVKKVNGEE